MQKQVGKNHFQSTVFVFLLYYYVWTASELLKVRKSDFKKFKGLRIQQVQWMLCNTDSESTYPFHYLLVQKALGYLFTTFPTTCTLLMISSAYTMFVCMYTHTHTHTHTHTPVSLWLNPSLIQDITDTWPTQESLPLPDPSSHNHVPFIFIPIKHFLLHSLRSITFICLIIFLMWDHL